MQHNDESINFAEISDSEFTRNKFGDYDYKNEIVVEGIVEEAITESHESYGQLFLKGEIKVPRLSGYEDVIPFVIQDTVLPEVARANMLKGEAVRLQGEVRTYKMPETVFPRLLIQLYVRSVCPIEHDHLKWKADNTVQLAGAVCQEPIYRETTTRSVCEMKVAVARPFAMKSDYIPCLVWGNDAKEAAKFKVGEHVRLSGRLQSRPYIKYNDDGTSEERCAYEVSAIRMSKDNN